MSKVRQINIATIPPRYVLIVERADGTWSVMEDSEQELKRYRPKQDETTSLHRVSK